MQARQHFGFFSNNHMHHLGFYVGFFMGFTSATSLQLLKNKHELDVLTSELIIMALMISSVRRDANLMLGIAAGAKFAERVLMQEEYRYMPRP